MTEKFRNKYRIASARLQTWDYSSNAAYFITLCTRNRKHFFGTITNGEMQLNAIGKIVETEWINTPAIRPDMNLELDEFVVMPNHFHAILIIGQNQYNGLDRAQGLDGAQGCCRDAMHCVSTTPSPSPLPPPSSPFAKPTITIPYTQPVDPTQPINKFGPQTKNLASVVRGFKSSVTTQVKKMLPDAMPNANIHFAWQPRYHDHIIRDAESCIRIREYIANNPLHWKEDKFYGLK
jgi:REP element-mobilizing transposase RayT